MPYSAITGTTGITSFPVVLTELITVPKLVIELHNLVPNKGHWVRAGYLQAVCMTNIGEVRGRSLGVNFGTTELALEIPAYPYRVAFAPRHYITRWTLQLSAKNRAGSDGTPTVPLVEAEATATGWIIWN